MRLPKFFGGREFWRGGFAKWTLLIGCFSGVWTGRYDLRLWPHFDHLPFFVDLIEKHRDHALQISLFVGDEPEECGNRYEEEHPHPPAEPTPRETQYQQFKSAQRPERDGC